MAVKRLHGGGHGRHDQLQREAQVMARLAHPNVIHVYDVGVADGHPFVAMERVTGETLRAWLEREPRGWREAVARLLAAGRGLAAAHRAGIVHRDFKPDNVLLDPDGRVLVSDFGLAHLADGGAGEPLVGGTPTYMSPEQHLGRATDARADQFGFCVALYEAVYRTRPSLPTSTLSGLKSRCTSPAACAAASPRPASTNVLRISLVDRFFWRIQSFSNAAYPVLARIRRKRGLPRFFCSRLQQSSNRSMSSSPRKPWDYAPR